MQPDPNQNSILYFDGFALAVIYADDNTLITMESQQRFATLYTTNPYSTAIS